MISRAFPVAAKSVALRIGIRTLLVGAVAGMSACASAPPQAPLQASTQASTQTSTQAPALTSSTDNASVASASGLPIPQTPEMMLEEVAIDDLVRALVQYRDPINTTLQTGPEMSTEDHVDLLTALSERGYGLQLVDADQGTHFLNYQVEDFQNSNSPTSRHNLQVGQLLLSRVYTVINNVARPISPLAVAGSRRNIAVDDSRFGENVTSDQLISRITFSVGDGINPGETPRISLLQLPSNAADNSALVGTNASGLEVSNIYSGGNNFGSLLDGYSRIEKVNVIFADDALRLGIPGRLEIEVFLEGFDEDSDLIRVIGCSNGTTNLAIGNEGLALGRAERVTQELIARGVTRERILDEGCWGPRPIGERFPSRGVVLELYRTS